MSTTALANYAVTPSLFPSTRDWAMMKEQAFILVTTGFLPESVKTAEQAIAIMLKGRELGMPTMQAFAHIAIIKGKPTLSAESMLAQIFKIYPTTKLTYVKNDNIACNIRVTKPGQAEQSFGFSWEDAQRAGLTSNPTWSKYTRAMLRSRAISEMARSLFPEAMCGISYTPEEMDDIEVVSPPMRQAPQQAPIAPVSAPPSDTFNPGNAEHKDRVLGILKHLQIPAEDHGKIINEMAGKNIEDELNRIVGAYS